MIAVAAADWHTGRCIFEVREWEEREEKKLWKHRPAIWKIIYKPNIFAYRSAKKNSTSIL